MREVSCEECGCTAGYCDKRLTELEEALRDAIAAVRMEGYHATADEWQAILDKRS
jgi:hypothetical protein